MGKRTGLGKGLGAIFGDEVVESAAEEQKLKAHLQAEKRTEKESKEEKQEIGKEIFLKVTSIEPNHQQPRKEFKEESLLELAESMKEYFLFPLYLLWHLQAPV